MLEALVDPQKEIVIQKAGVVKSGMLKCEAMFAMVEAEGWFRLREAHAKRWSPHFPREC